MATFARASSPTPGGALLKRAPYLETEEQAAQQPHRTYYYRQNHGEAGCEASIARCTAELASASGEVARALRRERAGYHARAGPDAALADYSARAQRRRPRPRRRRPGLHQARGEVFACLELSRSTSRASTAAFALDALGDLPRAVLDYTAAIAIDASHALAWYNRGIAHERLRDAEAAVLDFTKAIEHALAREAGAAKQGAAAKDRFPVADFYHNRAFCKRKLADFSGAVDDYAALAKDQALQGPLQPGLLPRRPGPSGRGVEGLRGRARAAARARVRAPQPRRRPRELGELEARSAFDTAIQLVGDGADKAPPPPGRRPRADSPTADDSQCLGAALYSAPPGAGGDRRTRGDVAVAKLYNARAYCLAKMDDFHGAVDDYSAALEHDADNTPRQPGISRDRASLDARAMADFNRVLDIEQKQAAAKRAAKEKRSSSRRSHSPP
ncbi:protein N-acetylglucosaminyltransferase [Aureococcus anophagefferens]|nr:protein N-acetylglucosaminyltransferase [Aureococcus anophagefferens]